MTGHDCPGLYKCEDHPKVRVVRMRNLTGWLVILPGDIAIDGRNRTQAAALTTACRWLDRRRRLNPTPAP